MTRSLKRLLVKIARMTGMNRLRRDYGVRRSEIGRLFAVLGENKIEYVVLRWFENIFSIELGQDIDMLVSDDDFARLRRIVRRGRRTDPEFIRVEIYSESNQAGNIAYYFPAIARQILNGRVRTESGIWVPNPTDYFFSLAYHALFHKGFASGLKSEYLPHNPATPKHDFERYLMRLSREVGLDLESVSMESLEQLLRDHGWLPPLDVYFRRSSRNEWAKLRVASHIPPEWRKNRGLAVFVIREAGVTPWMVDLLMALLRKKGASVLGKHSLTPSQSIAFSQRTRGGDWGPKGSAHEWGGLPKLVVIARASGSGSMQLGDEDIPAGVVEYDWVLDIKRRIRDEYSRRVDGGHKRHIVHSSDNGVEASYYVSVLSETLGLAIPVDSASATCSRWGA